MSAAIALHHPPVVLGFKPAGDELLAQIQPQFLPQAREILNRIPVFKPETSASYFTLRDGKRLRLDNAAARKRACKMAIGECWELMNLSEFLFKWNKKRNAKPVFKMETTQFDIEFRDHESCSDFLFELEEKWIGATG